MNFSRLKNEGWLYGLAFLVAIGFRMIDLGASPLTDSEAALALQALHIAQGKAPLLGPQSGYILLTSVLFAIIESTNFMARFVPAMMGSLLVFVPTLFREKIKPLPALLLAFFFAVDPGLVALSRQASGTILAVTFLLLAWGMWRNQRAVPAGIFAGLALLSGPSIWAGSLTLGLTWVFLQGMNTKRTVDVDAKIVDPSLTSLSPSANLEYRPALTSLVVTLLFGGTLFFLSPNGLSAWLSALPAYLKGWTSASSMTPGRMIFAFFAYEPLGIFLAVLSLIRGYRTGSRRILRTSLWLGVALLLAIFYRQTSELAWAIVPLLTLAAFELSRALNVYAEERLEVGVVVLALIILLVYIWFDISKIALDPASQFAAATLPLFGRNIPISGAPYIILIGAILIIILCVSFVAFGWSARTAWLGTTWSFVLFLGVYSLGSAWGASGVRSPNGLELWTPDPAPAQADLLRASVDDVSEFSLGHTQAQPVTIMGIDSPALEWILKDHEVNFVSELSPQMAPPPIIVTPLMDNLGLTSAYRGQDFIWRQQPLWDTITIPDWIRWLVFRQLPRDNETILLWVRNDLFPDARETTQQP